MNHEYDPRSTIAGKYIAVIIAAALFAFGPIGVLAEDPPPVTTDTLHVGAGYTYATIMSAITDASTNDKIVIHPGTYNESVILDRKLELHGTDMNTTVVNGNGTSALVIKINGCRISGLNLTGAISSDKFGDEVLTAGLELRSDHNEIYGCYIHNNSFGLLLRDADDNWMHDSISTDNRQHGVFLSGASQNRFDNFHCYDNDENGFGFFVSPDNYFYHCRSENNGANGWEILDSEREHVRFSTASNNQKSGFKIEGSFDINWIENSMILGNIEDGIWISTDEYPNIENCTIAENGRNGVKLSYNGYHSKARIFNNLIMNNTAWAVEIDPGSGWCFIVRNDIINNKNGQGPQVFDNGEWTIFNSGNTGNFWNDWTSPDENDDSIVDTPYEISGAASTRDEFSSVFRFTNHSYWDVVDSDAFRPYIIEEAPGEAIVDEMYVVYFSAVDRDTPTYELTWGVETSVDWLTMEGNILKGRPSVNDLGICTARIWVTDGVYTDEYVFDIDVLVDPYNNGDNEYPPKITSGHTTDAVVGIQYSNSYTASDPDTHSDHLVWNVTTNARFLTMDNNVLKGIPSNSDIGAFTVSITVDDEDYRDISSFTLIVNPPDMDDDVYEPEIIQIEELPRKETGETVLSVKDLTDGDVNFIEYEWYVNGVLAGSNTSLVVDLASGVYTIILRARALGNDWFEVTKVVEINGAPPSKRDIDMVVMVIGMITLTGAVLISAFLLYSRKRRRSSRDGWTIDDAIRTELSMEREGTAAKRGPEHLGPRSSLDKEYDMISREAMTWKRPSRFTMERENMQTKLRMKLNEGEIDNNLHRELADFIDDHFSGGKD